MASISETCIPVTGGTFKEAQEMRTCLMNMKRKGGKHKNISGKVATTTLNSL